MVIDAYGSLRVRDQLQQYLRPGEELLWYGGPDPSVLFTPADLTLVPFSILWLSFAIFWEVGVARGGGPLFFTLWGIPFIAIGLYVLAGRFVVKRVRKAKTAYGITGSRAMVVTGRSFSDLPLGGAPVSSRHSRDGRHVSVGFGREPVLVRYSWRRTRSRNVRSYAFYANTGLEPLARNVQFPVAFYDVADPDALLAAIERARTAS